MKYYANVGSLKSNIWCHMIADDLGELHTMAAKIGLKRSWFQHKSNGTPHYDLTLAKRRLAIEKGAISIDWRTFAKKTQEMRELRKT